MDPQGLTGYHLCFASNAKTRDVTLAFKQYFGETGFVELMAYDFWFMKLPSCDLLLAVLIWDETKKRHYRLRVLSR
jgi:hypothetical protein